MPILVFVESAEELVGVIGLGVIGIAIVHSKRDNKKDDVVSLS